MKIANSPSIQKTYTNQKISKSSKEIQIDVSNITISSEALKIYIRSIIDDSSVVAQINTTDILNMMRSQKHFFNQNPYSRYLASLVQYK